jgi:spore coat polysaccharide biosynthesis protein SpsF
MDIAGTPMLAHALRRLRAAERIDDIVLATTVNDRDDPLTALAEREHARWYRGSEDDVLARVTGAAGESGAEVVVRITGDCPLLDPEVVDRVVDALLEAPTACDYASNVLRRTYPKGLDAEAMWSDTLARMDRLASSPQAREHVTWFAYGERPDLFLLRSVEVEDDHSSLDFSVDTYEDLQRVRALVDRLGIRAEPIGWRRLLEHGPG